MRRSLRSLMSSLNVVGLIYSITIYRRKVALAIRTEPRKDDQRKQKGRGEGGTYSTFKFQRKARVELG